MQTHIDCLPCFLRQTIIALSQHYGQDVHREIIRDVLAVMQDTDMSRPPAYTTTFIHRLIRDKLGMDPFKEIKHRYNNIALELYPALRERVKKSRDPLWSAARLAIAGNIIDFGIFTSIDIEGSVKRALETSIPVDDYQSFKASVGEAKEILYLLDNAGEVVFDRLLIEELAAKGKLVTAVVKGSPVLNDTTLDDALQVGLPDICEVIDNGSDAIGTILELASTEFRETFHNAELVVSKGQGNFETLNGTKKKTYFLFQSKCDVVSKELGLSPGSMLLKQA
jgi:uncharacterized protein with ATP-grasp and redox domains